MNEWARYEPLHQSFVRKPLLGWPTEPTHDEWYDPGAGPSSDCGSIGGGLWSLALLPFAEVRPRSTIDGAWHLFRPLLDSDGSLDRLDAGVQRARATYAIIVHARK